MKRALLLALLLVGCRSGPPPDGYPEREIDVSTIPNAVPRVEPRTIAGNKSPYTVLGQTYSVLPTEVGYRETGVASFYGTKFHGQLTSNGERYDMFAMTAAHRTLPIPSYVRVTNLNNQKQVVVRINDRGPFHDNRIIDLSWTAARKLEYDQIGTAPVLVEAIVPGGASPALPVAVASTSGPGSATLHRDLGKPFLQVAALSGYDAALSLRDRLAAELGAPVVVQHEASGGGTLYKVRVGPLGDAVELNRLQSQLQQSGHPGAFLVFPEACPDLNC